MDYYEELGVPSSATDEEISKAHRRLTKLFHPDQQIEESNKLIAEKQMRRLNSMVALLTNPELRKQYDAHLKNGYDPLNPETFSSSKTLKLTAWRSIPWWLGSMMAAIVVSIAAIWIWAAQNGNRHPTYIPSAEDVSSASIPSSASKEVSTSETKTIATVSVPDRALASTAAPRSSSNSTVPLGTPSRRNLLEGEWFYVSQSKGMQAGRYPQFINLKIYSKGRALYGNYQAKYRVTDKPVQPDVNLTLTPKSPRQFSWKAENGNRGAFQVTPLDSDHIRIDWRTTMIKRGGSKALKGGSAILVRRSQNPASAGSH